RLSTAFGSAKYRTGIAPPSALPGSGTSKGGSCCYRTPRRGLNAVAEAPPPGRRAPPHAPTLKGSNPHQSFSDEELTSLPRTAPPLRFAERLRSCEKIAL